MAHQLAGFWRELGDRLHMAGQLEEAAGAYAEALALGPDSAECFYNLAVTRMRQNRLPEAAVAFEQALGRKPDYAEAHLNLGNVRRACGRPKEATRCYREAVRARPDYADARYNLALTLQDRDRLKEALDNYRELLGRHPGYAEAHNNAGNVLLALGRPAEAIPSYLAALGAQADHVEAQWNLAVTQLLLGNYEAGWEGFEWRFRQKDAAPRHFDAPLWDGAPLKGRTVLIHAEQGFGDTIQFIRFAIEAEKRGGTVLVECQPELAALFERIEGVARTVARQTPLPAFDCHAPLLSLPRILKTTLASLPPGMPYLKADADLMAHWKGRLAGWEATKIGVAWAGNPGHKNDRNRSFGLDKLVALAGAPDTVFFSLQKGPQAREVLNPPPGLQLIDLENELLDFDHTAAAIMNLDLVISVDTAVAHLTGALGRPVWTLLPFAPDWRWMMDRDDSPWYPTMRLFRQKRRGDWESVLREVREALISFQRSAVSD
jgi:tetratricopeptide (TPR) repeat protein